MSHRALIGGGTTGAMVAAICCATPALAVVLPLFGLGAWLGVADYVLMPLLVGSLALVGLGLHRKRTAAPACCETGGGRVSVAEAREGGQAISRQSLTGADATGGPSVRRSPTPWKRGTCNE